MYRNLLVPIDGTPLSSTTIEQAVSLAGSVGARVTFLHAQADFAATEDGALMQAMDPGSFSELSAGNARALLAKAAAAARAAQVEFDVVAVISDRPAEAILDTARARHCDLIFMASHGRRGLKGKLVGSVTQKVLQHATLPVLVAAVESNSPPTDEQQAVTIMRDEHRALGAVVNGLRRVLEQADKASTLPDFRLVRAMIFYIEHFPERLHHPKETEYLFRRLRQRTNELDALLDELEAQHTGGHALFESLRSLLDRAEADPQHGLGDFRQAVDRFAEAQWKHMATEERLVIPAASRYLTALDWAEVGQAFKDNASPGLDTRTEVSFEGLFERLVNLAAPGRQDGSRSA